MLLALFGPAASEFRYGHGVVLGLTILVIISGVHSIRLVDERHRYALGLAVPLCILSLMSLFVHHEWIVVIDHLLSLVFLGLVVKVMLDHVMAQRAVSSDLIRAGLVVYLLVGIWFADVYALFEFLAPGSFNGDIAATVSAGGEGGGRIHSTRFTYYSLVTLTTLGYGDITPASTLARSFSAVEAIIGPVFLAVFIGRLVGVQVAQGSNTDND